MIHKKARQIEDEYGEALQWAKDKLEELPPIGKVKPDQRDSLKRFRSSLVRAIGLIEDNDESSEIGYMFIKEAIRQLDR